MSKAFPYLPGLPNRAARGFALEPSDGRGLTFEDTAGRSSDGRIDARGRSTRLALGINLGVAAAKGFLVKVSCRRECLLRLTVLLLHHQAHVHGALPPPVPGRHLVLQHYHKSSTANPVINLNGPQKFSSSIGPDFLARSLWPWVTCSAAENRSKDKIPSWMVSGNRGQA